MRAFRDAAGVEWQAYQAERNTEGERRDHLLPAEYRQGWLVFESVTEKRRLAPVPAGWRELSDEALAALCATATVQTRRGGAKAGDHPVALPNDDRDLEGRRAREALERAASNDPDRAKLDEVQVRLNETLEEVCDAPAAEMLDTGELIRVEESLAIAADAAKEAVSLRRKRRSKRSRLEQPEQEQHE